MPTLALRREHANLFRIPDNAKTPWVEAACNFASNLQASLLQAEVRGLNDNERAWQEALPEIVDRLDTLLVARGARASREARDALAKSIIDRITRGRNP